MKTHLIIAVALLAASAMAPSNARTQDALLGAFSLTALDGGPLPAPSPDMPGLTIASVSLRLTADRFELESTFTTQGDSVQAGPVITGPWERTDEELRFFPEQAEPGMVVTFGYSWDGPRLVLTDENGHRWMMERVEGGASEPDGRACQRADAHTARDVARRPPSAYAVPTISA